MMLLLLVILFLPRSVAFQRVSAKSCLQPTPSTQTLHVTLLPELEDPSWKKILDDHDIRDDPSPISLRPTKAAIVKFSMISYIASMCVALPMALFPIWFSHKLGMITTSQQEHMALPVAQNCAKTLLQIIPFVRVTVTSQEDNEQTSDGKIPVPSIWCANHVSALDTFLFLATDDKIRGKNRRPIKVIYVWMANPITRLLFRMSGFIPVQMEANGSGNDNEYDRGSFLSMLRMTKKAFQQGYDVFILPEGQLNPTPEKGLMPVYSGAFALAKMSHRPIRFVGVHGTHKLWSANEEQGMKVIDNHVRIRTYPQGKQFVSGEDFVDAFTAVVGHFGVTGKDLPDEELSKWLL